MIAVTIYDIGKPIIERAVPKKIKKRGFAEYRDDSIELRRFLAAEIANREFEQRKDRALIENHRAGFMR
ncbi:MAG: hypothetical protein ACFFE2_11645 [Candidatus Thorarchaeota archaeon]